MKARPGTKLNASRAGLEQTVAAAAGLLEEGDRAHAGIADDARDLLLDEIVPDVDQPRRHFDDAELRALADDIRRRGVLQPVLVRPPATPGAPYRLVAGERRWRAARLAGRVRIPARVRDIADEEVQAAQLAENILRAGLTDIEKGRALRRLYELRKAQNYKTTWEDIAGEVGLGRARINDLFSLASLPESVAGLIEAGRLTGSHGILLQRAHGTISEDELLSLAHQAARPEGKRIGGCAVTVAQLRRLIHQSTVASPPSEHDGDTAARGRLAAASSPEVEGTGERDASDPALGRLRPFVRRTAEAAAAGSLTAEERQALLQVLGQVPPDPPAGTGHRKMNAGTVGSGGREGEGP